jgi:hypothetical protein
MAFITAIHIYVGGVREGNVAGIVVFEENVAGMAGDTVASDAECLFAVMAGPAGPAFFHLSHADWSAAGILLFEDFRVTLITISAMYGVAEENLANGLSRYVDF